MAFTLPDEGYVTLHGARYTHIARPRPSGDYTRGNYCKHCAEIWRDVEQVATRPDARIEERGTCARYRPRAIETAKTPAYFPIHSAANCCFVS